MNFDKHAFLLSLIDKLEAAGVPADRSHIHKSLFLLAEAVADLVPFGFIYRNGPYSYDIDEELSQMRSYAAISDMTSHNGNAFHEGIVVYRPDQNAALLREKYQPKQDTLRYIDTICSFVRSVGKPPIELDRQATVAWIMRREHIQGTSSIVSRFLELKPNSSRENIERALALVNDWFDKAEKFDRSPTNDLTNDLMVAMAA